MTVAVGNASARQAWFGQFLNSWLTAMVTGVYQEFGTIGGSALEMVAERQGVNLSDEDKPYVIHSVRLTGLTLDVGSIQNHLHPVGHRFLELSFNLLGLILDLGQEKQIYLKSKTPRFAGLSLARSAGLEPAAF